MSGEIDARGACLGPTANTVAASTPPPYLSAEQLAKLTPWSPAAIEKMIRRGTLKLGVHYFQPFGRRGRLVFKWEAVVALIEGRSAPRPGRILVESESPGATTAARGRRRIDVEKATTGLQRLLD